MSIYWEFEGVNLFKLLCPHKFKEYKSCHEVKAYSKNDFIYFEEDNANKIYLIENGKVKLGYYTDDGDEIIKAILGKGELFGEKAILGQDKHNEFAQSMDASTNLCVVSQNTLMDLMQDNISVSFKIFKFIGLRLKRIERRLEILLFKDTKTRLVEFLNDLKEDFEVVELDGNTVVKHPYTQNDIAKLIGTSRPTLNILINELKSENIIDFQRKKIIFLT